MIRRSLPALLTASITLFTAMPQTQAAQEEPTVEVPRSVKWLGRKLKAQAAYELQHKSSKETVEFQELAINSLDVCYVQVRYGKRVTYEDKSRPAVRRRYRAIMTMRHMKVEVERYGGGAQMIFKAPKDHRIDLSTTRYKRSDKTWKEYPAKPVPEFNLPIRDEKLARVMERAFNRWIDNCSEA